MQRYRPQIRADLLHEYGVDLGDWLRPTRAVKLLELIELCPSACRWREASANDLDYVRMSMAADDGKPKPAWAPKTSEYDLHALLLAQLTDLVGQMAKSFKAVKKYNPIPSPKTAIDQVELEQSMAQADFLIGQLTPHYMKKE